MLGALVCAWLSGCATTNLGGTVGTAVEGEGQAVDFSWIAEHPWAASFQQAGRFHLYAQYRRDGQPVEEDLGAGRLIAQRQIRFSLPAALRTVPEGPVCLFVGGGRNSAAVPVRAGAGAGGDTARFRYPAWEANVGTTSARRSDERDVAELGRVIPEAERRYRAEAEALAALGVRGAEDCGRLAVPSASVDTDPKDVVAPGIQASAAQRICVRRARNMRNPEYMRNSDYRIDTYDVVSHHRPAAVEANNPDASRRQAEGRMFVSHWQKWIDQTGVEYVPEVGTSSEFLPLLGTLISSVKDWNAHRVAYPGTPAPALIVNGILDAYKGCLDDVGKQLSIKYEAWQRTRANKPERDRIYAERKRSECVARVGEQGRMGQRISELRTELAAAQARLVAAGTVQPRSAPRRLLNGEACTL